MILLAALLLSCISAFAQNGKSIYQKYSGAEKVSTVYVSPAMFRIIGRIPDLKVEDGEMDLTPIISQLSGLYMIDSHNTGINSAMQADVNKFIASGHYELLMEANDEGEIMRMYSVGNEKVVNSFVMLVVDGDETTFVCIDGKMDRDKLDELIAAQMK